MADINSVIIVGRLTRDSELKYTSSGYAIGSFSIAVNRRKKSGDEWVDEVSYFDVNIFGKSAENLNKYLLKGRQVAIEGVLQQQRWDKDGKNQSKIIIVANNLQLLGGNSDGKSKYGFSKDVQSGFCEEHVEQSYKHDEFNEEIPF